MSENGEERESGDGRQRINVGIDLGTSRSAISTSGGEKRLIESYVGWPVDMVARKVLKRDMLVGKEALDNRLMLDLHRPLERGLIKEGSEKDAEAVRQLFIALLRLAGIEESDGERFKVRAVVGVPASAMRVNKQQLRDALTGVVDSLMIVSEPFAVAYGLDALLHALIIDIGAGTTDFCVMNGRYPTDDDQRTLTKAGDSVDQLLFQAISEHHPEAKLSEHMVREWKEQHGFVGEPPDGPVKVVAPVNGKPTEFDITQELKLACESLLPPLIEAMHDLISKVEPEYQAAVRGNVILSGGSSLVRGMGRAFHDALEEVGGGKVRVVKDPIYVGSDGGLAIANDAPDSDWEKIAT
ncbi:MAG: rod shape-determining protein [Thermoanaerobaculia bacterium]|nr:rod shape-determining protein [Thermoanaerobaculia bacterium]